MKKTVSISGARTRLLWASCISVSKSEIARRPRTMKPAPARRQTSTVSPSKDWTSIRSLSVGSVAATEARIASSRSATVSSDCLRGLVRTANDEPVEDRRGPAGDVEVPEGDRVERPGIDRDPHPSSVPTRR